MSDSKKAFEEALRRKEERQKEQEKKDNFSGSNIEYTEVNWLGLNEKGDTPIRIIGNPWEFRTSPTDVKMVYRSKIASDSKDMTSYCYINWKQKTNTINSGGKSYEIDSGDLDKSWLLYRFYESVNEHTWAKDDEDKNVRVYTHHSHPVFKKVDLNKTIKDSQNPKMMKYPNKFYPSKRILMNVLDPLNLDWHIENKKTKVLSSKISESKGQDGAVIYYPDHGVPFSIYESILNDLVANIGSWDYDIVINRDLNRNGVYAVRHFSDIVVNKAIKDKLSDKHPLLKEELELFDFDSLYPHSSYTKLKTHFGRRFQEWDGYKGTKFYEELCDLAEDEEKEREEKTESKTPVSVPEKVESKTEETKTEVKEEKPSRQRKVKEENVSIETVFPKLNDIDKEERIQFDKSFDKVENGKPVWKETDDDGKKVTLMPCDHCGTELPSTILQCPACGENLS